MGALWCTGTKASDQQHAARHLSHNHGNCYHLLPAFSGFPLTGYIANDTHNSMDLHFLYGDIWRCFDFSLVESRHTEGRCKPYLRILQPGSCRNADDFGTDGAAGRLGSSSRYLPRHIGCRHRNPDKTNGTEWKSWAKANHHRFGQIGSLSLLCQVMSRTYKNTKAMHCKINVCTNEEEIR